MFINQIFKSIKDSCRVCGQTPCNCTHIAEEKVRLDPKCWKGKKIGNPKTKMKGGVRVNNCVPAESVAESADPQSRKLGRIIGRIYNEIYDMGDDALDYLNDRAAVWAELWDRYEGDIDSIIAEEDPVTLGKAALELKDILNDLQSDQGVAEGAEFGAYYYEQLAQQVFDTNPNLQDENEILNLGYKIAKGELGSRAQGMFRDEDFPSDFVSAYGYLKKQGVAEEAENKDMTGQTCEKCKRGKYQERSQHDDMQGKVTCKCGHRVDRWKNYKEPGVAEDTMTEFAIDKNNDGDGRSKLIGSIMQLLKAGKKVDFFVPGIRGHVVGSGGGGDWLTLKRFNQPYSKKNYSLDLDSSDDDRFVLKMVRPDYYQVVEKQDLNQGVAEGLGKSIKRGLQGWGSPQDTPANIVKRNKAYDIDTAKQMRAGLDNAPAHSPAGLQKRVLDRRLKGVAEGEKNPHTSALGKALYRDLSKEKKASPAQVERNKLRWAQRQKAKAEQPPTKGMSNAEKVDKGWRNPNIDEGGEKWVKLPNGNYRNMHTGVTASTPPESKPVKPAVSHMYKVGWNDGVEDEYNDQHSNDPQYDSGFYAGLEHAMGPKGLGRSNPRRYNLDQGVAEGFFGIDDKIKGKIQNIVSRLSDEYGMWDHKAQTFTPDGLEHLKSILKFNDKYIKYALSLTSRDFEAEGVAEGSKKIPASNKPVDPKDLVVSLKDVPVKKPRGYKQYDPANEFPGVKAFKKQGVAEVSDATLTSYLTKVDADSQKHDRDPTKRSAEKRNKSVAGFSRAFNKLDARKDVKEVFQNDEANLMYRYDAESGRLKQRMVSNNQEQSALRSGYGWTPEEALKKVGIIRSKFDPKTFVQKQGNKWVKVFPYGDKTVDEAQYDRGDYYSARQGGEYGKGLTASNVDGGGGYINKGANDGQKGRPKKTSGFTDKLPADPFGRTTGTIPASAKPKKELDPFREADEPGKEAKYGKEYQDTVKRAGQAVKNIEKKYGPVDIASLAKRLNDIEQGKK